jgi:Glycosyltransferase
LARTLRELIDVPIVFTYHTKFDIDISSAINGELIRRAAIRLLADNIKACDEVWVVSRGAGENLRSLGYKGDYMVMENGVDLPKGAVSDEAVEKLREAYALDAGVPVFLLVGRLMWYKGIKLILDGLAALKSRGKIPFKMVFIGDGADKNDVIKYIGKLSLSGDCIFTGPIHDREVLRTWYSLADMLLFPSTYDTNGLVVREAAACGLPSLLIEGSCAAEGVTDGKTGILIKDEPEAMTEALVKICADIGALKRIGQAAMDEIYISWDDSVKRAAERYGVIIENWNSGGRHSLKTWPEEVFAMSDKLINELENMKTRAVLSKDSLKIGRRRSRKDTYESNNYK